jgi:chaperone required for assembly of F1-ATPase
VKRFWNTAEATLVNGGWTIALDGRPVKTPGRASLIVPTEALARAIADEWAGVEGDVDPGAMALTGIANGAIDRVAPHREGFAAGLARYGEGDLICYRAEGPPGLLAGQEAGWDALLAWARRHYEVDFATTHGLIPVAQPPVTVERLAHAVSTLDPFRLAALSPLVTIGGSLIIALAVLEKAVGSGEAWDAVSVDERWQLKQWGADAEAEAALADRQRDFLAAARFLKLLDA